LKHDSNDIGSILQNSAVPTLNIVASAGIDSESALRMDLIRVGGAIVSEGDASIKLSGFLSQYRHHFFNKR
jgi:hypothetical protein